MDFNLSICMCTSVHYNSYTNPFYKHSNNIMSHQWLLNRNKTIDKENFMQIITLGGRCCNFVAQYILPMGWCLILLPGKGCVELKGDITTNMMECVVEQRIFARNNKIPFHNTDKTKYPTFAIEWHDDPRGVFQRTPTGQP